MQVRKAVITAAGRGQQALPLQTLVDRDGVEKSVLGILVEEALRRRRRGGGRRRRARRRGGLRPRPPGSMPPGCSFVVQEQPLGYGHAVACAREFVAGEPFLHLVGDHLYVSAGAHRLRPAPGRGGRGRGCAVSAVQATRETCCPTTAPSAGAACPAAATSTSSRR